LGKSIQEKEIDMKKRTSVRIVLALPGQSSPLVLAIEEDAGEYLGRIIEGGVESAPAPASTDPCRGFS